MSDQATSSREKQKRVAAVPGFVERLRASMGSESQAKFAARVGISQSSLHNLLNGGAPELSTLIGISNALGRSLDWLAFGRGTTVGAAPGFVLIPHFDVQAGAGPGRLSVREPSTPYDEPAGGEVIAFREDWLRKKGINPHTAHVLTAVGDSMEPTIRDGDLLLVDRAIDRVRDLGLYVVTWGGFVMVKRVELRRDGTLVLKSDNRQYAEVLVGPDEIESLAVEGRVRWIARTT